MKNTKKDKNVVKNICIILLSILVLVLTIFLVFSKIESNKTGKEVTFLQDINNLQSKFSYYVGLTYSDTFGLYNNIEILAADFKEIDVEKEITNSQNNKITPLITLDDKIEKKNKIYHKIIESNVEAVLGVSMPTYEGLTWYVENGNLLKVDFKSRPDWWTDNLEVFRVGQN